MFRWIELLSFLMVLWFIANFVRYILYSVGAFDVSESDGNPLTNMTFGMANSWIKDVEQKKAMRKAEELAKMMGANEARKRRNKDE